MATTKNYREALKGLSAEDRRAWLDNPSRWRTLVDGRQLPVGTDVKIVGRFGEVRTVVVMNADGTPGFDRPDYAEAPATNVVAYGRGKDSVVRVAVIRQPRPHADLLDNQGVDGHAPVVFGQIPMGFLDKLLGGKFESPETGAAREVGEETGATAVLKIERPKVPWHNGNPSFTRSSIDLLFVEVDLDKVEALKADHNEPIYSAEYIPVPELLRRIREGKDETGAYYRYGVSNSLWFIFFATHPELFVA